MLQNALMLHSQHLQRQSSDDLMETEPPPAPVQLHQFQKKTFQTPVVCSTCDKGIWGIHVDGVSCENCGQCLHASCLNESKKNEKCVFLSDTLARRTTKSQYNHETLLRVSRHPNHVHKTNTFEVIQNNSGDKSALASVPESPMLVSPASSMHKELPKLPLTEARLTASDTDLLSPTSQNSRGRSQSSLSDASNQIIRKVHHFRGHQFLANYLEPADHQRVFQCQYCQKQLGDDGRQCYQCKLCDFYCHKKCYTKVKPCAVSFGTLEVLEPKLNEKDKKASVIQYRNSIRLTLPRKKDEIFIEDFSEEVYKINTVTDEKLLFDDYIIADQVLGSGQYGIVKKGFYKHNPQEKIAIKFIDKKRLWDPSSLRPATQTPNPTFPKSQLPILLQRELDILKKLEHPGIIRLHHFVDLPTQTVLIMDMAPDGDLLDYVMKSGKVSESETKFMAKQILEALNYLHERGVVHRDLKPENLLLTLTEDGKRLVRIADFGFATVFDKMHLNSFSLQSIVGTPAYMAPEVVDPRVWNYIDSPNKSKKGYDKSADIWSLGVIFYVCLGGVFPFDSQKPILDQILSGDFYFPDAYFENVSDQAIDLICHLLVVNPRSRFNCQQCLEHEWFQ